MFNKVKHSSVLGLRFDWRDCPDGGRESEDESEGPQVVVSFCVLPPASYVRNKFGTRR